MYGANLILYSMAKEILLYTGIYSYSAANFIRELEDNKGEDICVRGNCGGGSMFDTYGMIAKFKEHPKAKSIKVDGIAASAFAYMILETPASNVECLDVSTFLYHRAAMGYSVEDEAAMGDAEKNILAGINKSIRAAMENRADNSRFHAITGKSYDELFSMDSRIDVILNAEQAKALGFVGKVNTLTDTAREEILALSTQFNVQAFATNIQAVVTPAKKEKMTAAEFKAAHPEAYATILAEGVKAEQTRVKVWAAWSGVDPKASMEGIKGGAEMTPDVVAEFQVKAASAANILGATAEGAPAIVTPAKVEPTTDEKKEIEQFNADFKKNMQNFKL